MRSLLQFLWQDPPGAGKTEFSKSFDPDMFKFVPAQKTKIVRIDADEIRYLIPSFTGSNSSEVQRAASKGVDILFDYVQHNNQNAIVDGTLANYKIAYDKENANKIKDFFKEKIILNLIIKNFKNKVVKYHININKIDHYIKMSYNKKSLELLLK